jgi:hypothetical protein
MAENKELTAGRVHRSILLLPETTKHFEIDVPTWILY